MAHAADRNVPSVTYPTIQSAINAAETGDTVRVGAGIYNERLNMLGKQISVIGAGQFLTIIDPQGGGGHLVTCATGETTATVIEGMTLRLSPTGAVYLNNAGVTLRACRMQSNSSDRGAAILGEQNATAVLDHCVLNFNTSSNVGGAVCLGAGGTLTAVNSTFQGNTAFTEGGAVYMVGGGSMSMSGCSMVGNTARRMGGAMFLSAVSGSVSQTQFSGNRVLGEYPEHDPRGGSLALSGVCPQISYCDFNDCLAAMEGWTWCSSGTSAFGGSVYLGSNSNSSFVACNWIRTAARVGIYGNGRSRGGAVYCDYNAISSFIACSFVQASAFATTLDGSCGYIMEGEGGAIAMNRSSPSIVDCRFEGCAAQGQSARGGALRCWDFSSPTVMNSEFTNCGAIDGGAVFMDGRSSPTFGACEFRECTGSSTGGVARAGDAPALFFDSLFQGNQSNSGSVLWSAGPQFSTFVNCDFCSNSGADIVGSYVDGGSNETAKECPEDCNANGLNDAWDLEHGFTDCDMNGTLDVCDIAATPARDCNGDGTLDSCQAGTPGAGDCDADGVPDACEADCDDDGIPDDCAVADDLVPDCNANGIPDSCDLERLPDCNGNGIPDACDPDCDHDGTPDDCEILAGAQDCDADGVPDACELATNPSLDLNKDGTIDACQPGMQYAGLQVEVVPIVGRSSLGTLPATAVCYRIYAKVSNPMASVVGFYGNGSHPMVLAAPGGFWNAADGGGTSSEIPCELGKLSPEVAYDSWLTIGLECADGNGVQVVDLDFDAFDAGAGIADDNAVVFVLPGIAQSVAGPDGRVLLAQLTATQPVAISGSFNLVGRNSSGTPGAAGSWVAVGQQIPAPDLVDCNGNGIHDAFDIALGNVSDCDEDGVPDSCQRPGAGGDCNGNGEPDFCDIVSGFSLDANANDVPDECECPADLDGNGRVDADDLVAILVNWGGGPSSGADIDGDGWVDAKDLGLVLSAWGPCD